MAPVAIGDFTCPLEPYTRPAAVFRDEINAGGLKGRLDSVHGALSELLSASVRLNHGRTSFVPMSVRGAVQGGSPHGMTEATA
jgi:hypothetical protein